MTSTSSLPPTVAPMVPALYRVTDRRRENHDTVTITIAPGSDRPALEWPRPGQFHMLSAFGVGEVPISVSGLVPGHGIEHTIRAVGEHSRALERLKVGDALGVRGPFGSNWGLDAVEELDVVLVAGGIGLAPLRPAVEYLVENRDRFGTVRLLVGARRPEELCFTADLDAWSKISGAEVVITVDAAQRDWRGHVGVVTHLIDSLEVDAGRTAALVCGPEIMMRFAARALTAVGIAPERVQLSAERNMKCAIGHCGHCQYGPHLICRDGPVFGLPDLAALMEVREL